MLAGCGGDAGERAAPTATATATPTPTAFAPSAPEPPEDAPEAQPGGAGDEEPAVTRLALVVGRGGVTPSEVEAPAFLAIEITVRNETPDEQLVVVARDQGTVTVAAGRTGRVRLAGLRPGRYRITARNTGAATLVVKRSTP